MTDTDATRQAGAAYSTRVARGTTALPDDKTRIAQEGYQSKVAREATNVQPDSNEFYKIGDKIGDRYEVSVIHHGAMGVVYGCFDHETKLPRALKTVRARYTNDKQALSMFENEAAVWLSMEKHPYIVRAYMVERFKNLPYVVTEYVCGSEGMGGDLRGWLGHSRLTLPVAVAMALQIAQGMQHAVRKVPNLLHRDLKPANILVDNDGKAMVTDFGLVNALQDGAGTPAYMSPEQWSGGALDLRSDIYAYGCILFEMFTAHRLFTASSESEWQLAHLHWQPASLVDLVPEIPKEIDTFVERCLSKKSDLRPQNWDEVVTFFAEWFHRLTGKAVVLNFSSLELDAAEWLLASYSLSNLKRYNEMLFACEKALAINNNSPGAWGNKGYAFIRLNRFEDALSAYDHAITLDQNVAIAWTGKAGALCGLDRHEDALVACDHALAIDKNTAAAWNNKGQALRRLNRLNEALDACDQALLIDGQSAISWCNRGATLQRLTRNAEAILAFDQSILINQNCVDAWCGKGTAFLHIEQYEEAVFAFDQALLVDHNLALAWDNKGYALYCLKRFEEAVEACTRAIEVDPGNASVWCRKGLALFYLGMPDSAIHAYDQALTIDKNLDIAWLNKGVALRYLKKFQEANSAYDQALSVNPKYANAWINKGLLLTQECVVLGAFYVGQSAIMTEPAAGSR
jgi:tetratricopeptide (TPR) repeat protein